MTGKRPAASAERNRSAGFGMSSKALQVSASEETSCKRSAATRATTGPRSGTQTRAISSARAWSLGRQSAIRRGIGEAAFKTMA